MFKAVWAMQDIGSFNSMKEAFKAIFDKLKEALAAGGLSLQVLETAVWVEPCKLLP